VAIATEISGPFHAIELSNPLLVCEMVEVKLEPADGNGAMRDLYVALRIGETQKLTRASKARTYKFPSSTNSDRRYGKIEIFKRIGGCSVPIDPASFGKSCPVNVPLEHSAAELDNKTGMLFHMSLCGDDGRGTSAQEKPPNSARKADPNTNPKVVAAKEYVDEHNLEMRLADAMQAVLRERPADPAEFISARLAASKPPSGWRTPKKAEPPATEVLPFRPYYTTHFRTIGSEAFSKIHEAFPRKSEKRVAPSTGPKDIGTMPTDGYYKANMASCPANFLSCPAACWEQLHAKFDNGAKKVVDVAATSCCAAYERKWNQRPSIGPLIIPVKLKVCHDDGDLAASTSSVNAVASTSSLYAGNKKPKPIYISTAALYGPMFYGLGLSPGIRCI